MRARVEEGERDLNSDPVRKYERNPPSRDLRRSISPSTAFFPPDSVPQCTKLLVNSKSIRRLKQCIDFKNHGEQVTSAKVRIRFTDTVKSISGRERTGHLHPTLQPLLRLPEFLQFREVLVEDEHFGEAERRCHRRRRRRHRRGANLRPPPRLRRRRHHHRSPHRR